MIKQKIKSIEAIECCINCGKFSVARIEIARIDIKYRHDGFIIAPDLFDKVFCEKCFILHIQNTFQELKNDTTKKGTKPEVKE